MACRITLPSPNERVQGTSSGGNRWKQGKQVCDCRWRRTGGKGYLSMDVATESEVADTKGSTATVPQ